MSYYDDLTPFTYGSAEPDPAVLNIGWLSHDHDISTALPNEEFVLALRKITAAPIKLFRGYHICDFCPRPPTALSKGGIPMLDAPTQTRGNGEVWVKSRDGITYVAPALVLHYVIGHHYAPPQGFVDAVIDSR